MTIVRSGLALIDLFGRPVTISFFGKEKFKSSFGGLCSIIFFGFLAWALYTGSKDLFDRTNPSIINSETFLDDPREMIISPDTFPIGIGIQAPVSMNFMPYLNESIYTVDFVYARMVRTGTDGDNLVETFTELILEKEICNSSHFGEMAYAFAGLSLTTAYCLKPQQPSMEQIRVQGVYMSNLYEYIMVKVTECRSTDENPKDCAPREVLDEYLNGGWFNVLHVNMGINPNNFTRPDARYRNVYSTMIGPSTYKESYFELGHADVATDQGWIVPEVRIGNYSKVNDIIEYLQVQSNPDGILLVATFEMHRLETHCQRTYKKIQDVLAEVGGLANVALVVIFIVITPYLELKFRESLVNELFDIYPLPDKKNSLKKQKQKLKKGPSLVKQNQQDEHDHDKDKTTQKMMNLTKSEDIQIDLSKSNQTFENLNTNLHTKNAFLSPMTKAEVKKRIDAWGMRKNEKEASPVFGPSPPDSPKRLMNVHLNKHKSTKYGSKYPSIAEMLRVKNKSWHNLDADHSPEKHDSIIQSGSNMQSGHALEIGMESPKPRSSTRGFPSMSHQEKLFKLDQKVVEENEENNPPEYPSLMSEGIFSDCPLEDKDHAEKPGQHDITKEDMELEKRDQVVTPQTSATPAKFPRAFMHALQGMKAMAVRKPQRINLTVWEYLTSFFYQSERLKQKMDILTEGITKIDARLDVINIMKKLREIDKLKAMLMEHDQLILFENLPKPEIRPKGLRRASTAEAFSHHGLLRKATFVEGGNTPSVVLDAHDKITEKTKKSKIDNRLISIYKENVS